ncbi:MAG: family 20 glycosylhydrolase [Bacteroidetes bacterium]|nr:family 20 glycosylhydrolase [Bacteroidota bacterium]
MKKTYILLILLAQVLISCNPKPKEKGIVEIIPQPTTCKIIPGFFELNAETKIVLPPNVNSLNEAGILQDVLAKVTGFTCDITTDDGIENAILFKSVGGDVMGTEGYELEVNDDQVIIRSAADAGFFYGIQTLLQILPSEVFGDTIVDRNWKIPQCQIEDHPRFSWRGMHLDVSRHFFPVSFVKKYIDLIAMHKMNKFHWHLTDDNGWRIEIKKYPKLTDVAAWRVDRTSEPWREVTPPKPGEKATYGGYYTQDEIREVVAYAAKRHVEIIPEIEMPGHTSEVFAAYPELSCAGEELYVQPGSYWPNVDIFCAGKEETFTFIENVLTEVMELFPSEYVHIGGDEATKDRWEACPLCQKRMKEEGLSNEHELQSWFIKRVEKFLNAHGKKLIGWDEILEGGLAPEATVMSWRGFHGGIDAARQGHDVVMCPTAYCYFDYYQADPDFEPEAIGGLTTLKKVYAFEPIPADLNVEQSKHILGAQGNLWTEFIQTPEHAEYMALPRMTALAEVVWSPVANRDWSDFLLRLQEQFNRFDQMDVNYSRGSWKVTIEPTWEKGAYQIALETEQINPLVHFTLDGSDPSLASPIYKQPFSIDSSVIIKAGIFKDDQLKEAISKKEIIFHKAFGLRGILRMEPNQNYMAKGSLSLTDGLKGSDNFRDGYWLGFQGDDLDFTVDLEKPVNIQQVSISFLQNEGAWIIMPKEVKIEILDSEMQVMAKVVIQPEYQPEVVGTWIEDVAIDFDNIQGNIIHILAKNYGRLPDWHAYAGNEAWIFVDEVVVN